MYIFLNLVFAILVCKVLVHFNLSDKTLTLGQNFDRCARMQQDFDRGLVATVQWQIVSFDREVTGASGSNKILTENLFWQESER